MRPTRTLAAIKTIMSSKLITDVYKQTKRTRQSAKNTKCTEGDEVSTVDASKLLQGTAAPKTDEEVLRDFDLSLEFGPCIGVSRLERWERAHKHGLNPPAVVKQILLRHSNDTSYTQCLWNEYNI